MKPGIKVLVAALVVICGGVAQAQYEAGSNEAGFTLGAAIPLTKTDLRNVGGKEEASVKTGFNLSGRYLRHTSPEWAFGGEIGYAAFGDKELAAAPSGTTLTLKNSVKTIAIEGLAKYTINPQGKTRPYLIGGIGYGNVQQKTETKPTGAFVWSDTGTTEYRTNFDESSGAMSLSLGLGLERSITDSMALGFEARWRTIRVDETVQDKVFSSAWELENANGIVLTAGLNWKFGQ